MAYGKASFQPGYRQFTGGFLQTQLSKVFQGKLDAKDTITAHSGGTKAAAVPLINSINRISICAADHDSVLMPPALAGSIVMVINSGADILDVYGKGADTIDGVATATANTIATTKAKTYACVTKGAWFTVAAT